MTTASPCMRRISGRCSAVSRSAWRRAVVKESGTKLEHRIPVTGRAAQAERLVDQAGREARRADAVRIDEVGLAADRAHYFAPFDPRLQPPPLLARRPSFET